ncbi:MAG: DUF1049 domain-containing protein [Cyanobacteria bacterium Co-bin8]|nr:DUF1049 domain-containing protein [Cyanobacteria bacterium Co-bin8]
MAKLIAALLLAIWVAAIAIFSAQNGTPISLQFFGLRSIQLPLGMTLAFFAAASMIGTALVLPVFTGSERLGAAGRRLK